MADKVTGVTDALNPAIATVKAGAEAAKEVIDAANQYLDLYNRVFEQIVPWRDFEATLTEMGKYQSDYSKESATLLGKITTLMYDGKDAYFKATEEVSSWSELAAHLLKIYVKLFDKLDEEKAKTQRSIMLNVINSGIAKLTVASNSLSASSASFNGVVGQLTQLNGQLASDFNSTSDYYRQKAQVLRDKSYGGGGSLGPFGLAIAYGVMEHGMIPELTNKMNSIRSFFEETRGTVSQAIIDINSIKNQLVDEVHLINRLKTSAEQTIVFIEYDMGLKDLVVEAAQSLIANCEQYYTRHNKNIAEHKLFGNADEQKNILY